jgi:hypothetical protein
MILGLLSWTDVSVIAYDMIIPHPNVVEETNRQNKCLFDYCFYNDIGVPHDLWCFRNDSNYGKAIL